MRIMCSVQRKNRTGKNSTASFAATLGNLGKQEAMVFLPDSPIYSLEGVEGRGCLCLDPVTSCPPGPGTMINIYPETDKIKIKSPAQHASHYYGLQTC